MDFTMCLLATISITYCLFVITEMDDEMPDQVWTLLPMLEDLLPRLQAAIKDAGATRKLRRLDTSYKIDHILNAVRADRRFRGLTTHRQQEHQASKGSLSRMSNSMSMHKSMRRRQPQKSASASVAAELGGKTNGHTAKSLANTSRTHMKSSVGTGCSASRPR